MSATIEHGLFEEYFSDALGSRVPTLLVDGRYSHHFNRLHRTLGLRSFNVTELFLEDLIGLDSHAGLDLPHIAPHLVSLTKEL